MSSPATDRTGWPSCCQFLLRGVLLVGAPECLAGGRWLAAGVLLMSGLLGLTSAWRCRTERRCWVRLGDGTVDLLGGTALLMTPATPGPWLGVWAMIAGGWLIVHAVPSRLRDSGPAWAWVWTGLPMILTGLHLLVVPQLPGTTAMLSLGAAGLMAGTMAVLLGLDLVDPEVLTMPEEEWAAETTFTANTITWRPTAPEQEPPKAA